MKVLIIGLGSVGHSIAARLRNTDEIDVLVSKESEITEIKDQNGEGNIINNVYDYDNLPIKTYDLIFLTLPNKYKINRTKQIKDIIPSSNVCVVPGNQGIIEFLDKSFVGNHNMILFERVPYITRINKNKTQYYKE